VRTKSFKDWFGDWEKDPENASKVLDTNGEPLVVFHGSSREFESFNPQAPKQFSSFSNTKGVFYF
jgi:hypothetical protein